MLFIKRELYLCARVLSSSYAEVALNISKNTIAQSTRLANITRTQGEAQALSCGIRLMHCHVTPPYASIVPEMVILILIINAKSDLGILR